MSPVVLRKEIDNLIAEDEDIMRYPQFIDNHETQFWNLLYGLFTFHFDFFSFTNFNDPIDHCQNGSKMRSHENLRDSILFFYSSDGSLRIGETIELNYPFMVPRVKSNAY